MVRQNIRFDPSVKLFESFADFSGGVNSETSNERLKNNEYVTLDNVDLSGRGSARRRTGRIGLLSSSVIASSASVMHELPQSGGSSTSSVTVSQPIVTGRVKIYATGDFDIASERLTVRVDGSIVFDAAPGRNDEPLKTTKEQAVYVGEFELPSSVAGKTTFDVTSTTSENVDNADPAARIWYDFTLVHDAITGKGQGLFQYYRKDQAEPDLIMAVGGRLYLRKPDSSTFVPIPIAGLSGKFQDTLPIEAVQYKDLLFIATGTKLVEYDGTSAKVVEPYKPTAMEAIYIGTNALAPNPDGYIQDQEAPNLDVAIKPQKRSGVTNQICTMTAFVSKPASITSVKYKWEYRKVGDTSWTLGKDFDTAAKSWDFKPTSTGKYELKVTVQNAASTSQTADYTITNYPVNDVEDKGNITLPVESIQTCRKIMLHWDRIILAKDNKYPHQMYISDLNNPRYFPTTNSINFDANKQEPITAMVRYRDMLVVFTKTTIQTLLGKSPSDYRRALIHDGVGCVADRTAHVIGNHIIFLSNEGIQMLAPSALTLDTLNVKRVDYPIKSAIIRDPDAAGMVHDNQYWICLPSQSVIYRFYYDGTVWVRDKSSKLNICSFVEFENQVYELTLDGKLYKQDKTVYSDIEEPYDMIVESKYLDLSTSFNQKKLKRLYVLAKHFTSTVNLKVRVYADSALVLNPESGEAVITEDGAVEWSSTTAPNFKFYTGTVIGEWIVGTTPLGDVQLSVQRASVRGKCRRVKVVFVHSEAKPCEIYAFGLEFKQKKV